jgi:hypothetical protein
MMALSPAGSLISGTASAIPGDVSLAASATFLVGAAGFSATFLASRVMVGFTGAALTAFFTAGAVFLAVGGAGCGAPSTIQKALFGM